MWPTLLGDVDVCWAHMHSVCPHVCVVMCYHHWLQEMGGALLEPILKPLMSWLVDTVSISPCEPNQHRGMGGVQTKEPPPWLKP